MDDPAPKKPTPSVSPAPSPGKKLHRTSLRDLLVARYQRCDRLCGDAAEACVDPAGDGVVLARSATGCEVQLQNQLDALERFCTGEGLQPRLIVVSGEASIAAPRQYLRLIEEAFAAGWCRWSAAYDLSRYARRSDHRQRLMRSATEHEVELRTIAHTFKLDPSLAEDAVIEALWAAIDDERARAQLRARTLSGGSGAEPPSTDWPPPAAP
jgi:hypothetical protein